jgi:acetoin utilization protein AcuB
MKRRHIRHLPAIDGQGDIVGVLSERDLLRAMRTDRTDFFLAATPAPEFEPNACVRDWMSWPIETIDSTASVADAARAMVARRISCLLITRDERFVGILTTTDLLKALIADDEGPLLRAKDALASALAKWPVSQIAQALSDAGL